jgi:U4/U6.U5 tri-snRNP-associated protein 2
MLLKKIWNPKNFKGLVSPHEFLQSVTDASAKKFKIGTQSDPSIFLLWLIDNLKKGLKK